MKTFQAKVIVGEGRGRQLGFPTINLDVQDLDLEFGVYAALVSVNGENYYGAMNYGSRPTFNQDQPLMEIHLLDFNDDLYHQEVEVEILQKLRDVKKFSSKEELITQIQNDLTEVRVVCDFHDSKRISES